MGLTKIYYSDFDDNGVPRAEYVPRTERDFCWVRKHAKLLAWSDTTSPYRAFKEDEAYSIQYGTITLPDNTTTAAFYCTPINRNLGNEAMGQARLVLNSPYTLCGKDSYEWKNNSSIPVTLPLMNGQHRDFDIRDACDF